MHTTHVHSKTQLCGITTPMLRVCVSIYICNIHRSDDHKQVQNNIYIIIITTPMLRVCVSIYICNIYRSDDHTQVQNNIYIIMMIVYTYT
jgi:uncharacterized membrane protein